MIIWEAFKFIRRRDDGHHERKIKRFFLGQSGVCTCCCGKCRRTWKYLEISIAGSKRWRRTFPARISDTCADIWFYTAYHRDSDRTKDRAGTTYSIRSDQSKEQIHRSARLSCTCDHTAVLLYNRWMGTQILYTVFDRKE